MEKSYKDSLIEMMVPKSIWTKKVPTGQFSKKVAKQSLETNLNNPQFYEYNPNDPQYSFLESMQFQQEQALSNETDVQTL